MQEAARHRNVLNRASVYAADCSFSALFETRERGNRGALNRPFHEEIHSRYIFYYDGKKHTEKTFKDKLQNTLSHLCSRKKWKYAGVWERSPEKKRLHFHGLFYIPDGTMPGELQEVNDFSLITHKRQTTVQNTYFNERFGRSDFEKIDDNRKMGAAVAYILKYIEKTGERIVYSRGLPQYFISDILPEDVVMKVGQEEKKLLLFDDFKCIDEGCIVGTVSEDTIRQMPKCN